MPKHRADTAEKNELLFDAIHALRNEIAEFRDAIDELREEIQWGNRNREGYNPALLTFHPERLAPLEAADLVQAPAPRPGCRPTMIDELQDATPRRQQDPF